MHINILYFTSILLLHLLYFTGFFYEVAQGSSLGLVIKYGGGGYKNLTIKRLILCGPPLIFLQNIHDPPPIWH